MEYERINTIIEAFQFGIDKAPLWFIEAVNKGEVLVYDCALDFFKKHDRCCILLNSKNEFSVKVIKGDFIRKCTYSNNMISYKEEEFFRRFRKRS